MPKFQDRTDAGRRLAGELLHLKEKQPVILALPRGGVPVAAEIAQTLQAPLDLVFTGKIGAPFQPELAIGAVADGNDPVTILDRDLIAAAGIDAATVKDLRNRKLAQIEERKALYLQGRESLDIRDRVVVVVDDGIATGATVRAALRVVRQKKPERIVLAVPVAPSESLASLKSDVDDTVCLLIPAYMRAIGLHYRDFTQVDDATVQRLLRENSSGGDPTASENMAKGG